MKIKKKDLKDFIAVMKEYLEKTMGLEQRIVDSDVNFFAWLNTKMMFSKAECYLVANDVYTALAQERWAKGDDTKYTAAEILEQAKALL